ncbi:hypothetical protein HY484_00935 [Candidatus Woesearchaeota archaeon]|nr:hypothetical protein [Candidatus Woesearchaeota archaeon]
MKRDIADSPQLAKVFTYVCAGYNYPQTIAKSLDKKPQVALIQLQKLRRAKILWSKKERLMNKTVFFPNWDKLAEIVHQTLQRFSENQKISNNLAKYVLTEQFYQDQFRIFAENVLKLKQDFTIRRLLWEFVTGVTVMMLENRLPSTQRKQLEKDIETFLDTHKKSDLREIVTQIIEGGGK